MKTLFFLITLFLASGHASAQSLKPENPYPLKEGINEGTSDSSIGMHYWYFFVLPGTSLVTVRLKQPKTVFGAKLNNVLTVTLSDDKRTWHRSKVVTSDSNQSEVSFRSNKIDRLQKIIVSVSPPSGTLLRMGGDYEIEVTGDVKFDELKNTADPIIGTYSSYVESFGATRFLADGSLETSDGLRGRWQLFDLKNRIYTVIVGNRRYSVQFRPGSGLVKVGDPTTIIFQELR